MESLTLDSVAKEIDKLENDRLYWEQRLEQINSLTRPQSTDLKNERVDGGKKVDKLLQYTEIKEELGIEDTLKYIKDKLLALNEWVERELERLDRYGETEKKVVYLREHKRVRDRYTYRMRNMTWNEIAKETHYSERAVRLFYEKATRNRQN